MITGNMYLLCKWFISEADAGDNKLVCHTSKLSPDFSVDVAVSTAVFVVAVLDASGVSVFV